MVPWRILWDVSLVLGKGGGIASPFDFDIPMGNIHVSLNLMPDQWLDLQAGTLVNRKLSLWVCVSIISFTVKSMFNAAMHGENNLSSSD